MQCYLQKKRWSTIEVEYYISHYCFLKKIQAKEECNELLEKMKKSIHFKIEEYDSKIYNFEQKMILVEKLHEKIFFRKQ